MKKMWMKIAAVLVMALSVMCCFAACNDSKDTKPQQTGISEAQAEEILKDHLLAKGFDDDDFLAEGRLMELDGVRVYAFSWRTKVSENADRLFGTYAVSLDGLTFYEYQSERETWIRDMSAGWDNE